MEQIVNSVYEPVFTTDKRYTIIMGGRAAGRSYVASQFALAHLVAPEYFRCAIMRYVLGDIRNSIFQEIKDRIEEQGAEEAVTIRDNTLTLEYGDNKINGIGFRKSSSDQKSKLKSLANYTTVIIEEADEVSEEDFIQLDDSLRTMKSDIRIVLLLNPPDKNHWIVRRWCNLVDSGIEGFFKPVLKASQTDTTFIHTNYKDNVKNLNATTIRNFELYKDQNPDHYYNMIEGLVSEGARGRIFKNWLPITDAEFEALPHPSYYGTDFGFTNDPAAVYEIKEHNDTVWARELIFETGLLNKHLSARMGQLGMKKTIINYADAAEPKSIAELCDEGWYVVPTAKGADSRRARVNYLKGKQVYYTESSINLAREHQTYSWALDRNKEPTNEPQDGDDHGIDAVSSAVWTARKHGGELMA
ncbi:PBSX family phage terminase large subunit [Sulfitobacter sp. 1A10445]|uniref:PBSX family phage terminase large subunit n=1 Tax=unclassified Sulfitobacter TaxID=196795 RepID=UPI003746F5A5